MAVVVVKENEEHNEEIPHGLPAYRMSPKEHEELQRSNSKILMVSG